MSSLSGIFFGARSISTPYWRSDLWAWLTTGWASDGYVRSLGQTDRSF